MSIIRFLTVSLVVALSVGSSFAQPVKQTVPSRLKETAVNAIPALTPTAYLENGLAEVQKKDETPLPSMGSIITRFIISLLIVIGCIYLVVLVLRKTILKNVLASPDQRIKVLARYPLDPKKNIYLLEVADRWLVIGSGEHELVLLSEIRDKETMEAFKEKHGGEAHIDFKQHLKGANGVKTKDGWGDTYKVLNQANDLLKDRIKSARKITDKFKPGDKEG